MWIFLSLTAAFGAAGTSLVLKRAVEHGGVVVSTVAFRFLAGLLLLVLAAVYASDVQFTSTYWLAAALAIPPEVGGMLCLTMALRSGDLSLVQPILGLIPLLVMVGGIFVLNEIPAPVAAVGVVLVTTGVYFVGMTGRTSLLEPFRALARAKASRYAMGAVVFWTMTSVIHKIGIAEVGPFPWAVTLILGSALLLTALLPIMRRRIGTRIRPMNPKPWTRLMLLGGVVFALQQVGLHLALQIAQAGYVVAVNSTSTFIATLIGVLILKEGGGSRYRIVGGTLVTCGAVLIALAG